MNDDHRPGRNLGKSAPLRDRLATCDPSSSRPNDKEVDTRQGNPSSDFSQKQSTRPSVHYPYFNTPPNLESRASSFAGTDEDDDGEEEFDDSDDQDLVDEEAKFVEQMGVKLGAKRWTIWRLFTILFSSLIGSVFLACVLVTPAVLVHFFWYKPHPTSYRHYVDLNIEAWLFWAAVNVVISWGLAMIVDIIQYWTGTCANVKLLYNTYAEGPQ